MTQSKLSIMPFLLTIISFLYIFEYTKYGTTISGTKYILIMVLIFLAFIKDSSLLLIFPNNVSALTLFTCFGLIPFFQAIANGSITIGIYTAVMLMFIAGTYIIGRLINNEERMQWFVTTFAIIGTVTILICYLKNAQNLFDLSAIISNFTTELDLNSTSLVRERSAFGFIHANSLGGICLAVIVSLTMIQVRNTRKKIIKYLSIFFVFLIMLNTGSRASIYGIGIYLLVIMLEELYYHSSKAFKFVLRAMIAIAVIYFCVLIWGMIANNFEFVNKLTSYRLEGWVYDIQKMNKDGTLLFGYGLYNPVAFFSQPFSQNMIVDNWYVYMITNIGLIGFVGCIIFIISMGKRLSKKCKDSNIIAKQVFALFFANLAHAMAEKAFITPADPISFFMMVLVFGTLYNCR